MPRPRKPRMAKERLSCRSGLLEVVTVATDMTLGSDMAKDARGRCKKVGARKIFEEGNTSTPTSSLHILRISLASFSSPLRSYLPSFSPYTFPRLLLLCVFFASHPLHLPFVFITPTRIPSLLLPLCLACSYPIELSPVLSVFRVEVLALALSLLSLVVLVVVVRVGAFRNVF